MISRRTIFSLLLTLLLAAGLMAWSAGRRDECSVYLAGVPGAPANEVVAVGSHVIRVRCDEWFLRQLEGVQVLCLAVGAGVVVFGLSVWGDWQRRRRCRLAPLSSRRPQ